MAGEAVDTGKEAKCFGDYMRIHTLEAAGGLTYARMPRYATDDGKGTNDASEASKGPGGAPADNAARNIWVTETALTTALYTAYFAENVALFAILVGASRCCSSASASSCSPCSPAGARLRKPRRGTEGRRRGLTGRTREATTHIRRPGAFRAGPRGRAAA